MAQAIARKDTTKNPAICLSILVSNSAVATMMSQGMIDNNNCNMINVRTVPNANMCVNGVN